MGIRSCTVAHSLLIALAALLIAGYASAETITLTFEAAAAPGRCEARLFFKMSGSMRKAMKLPPRGVFLKESGLRPARAQKKVLNWFYI